MDEREPEAWRPGQDGPEDSKPGFDGSHPEADRTLEHQDSHSRPEEYVSADEIRTTTEADDEIREDEKIEFERFGYDLAVVMEANNYHPVIIFGTNNSGKTSLLMSLFAVLRTESDKLRTGLTLGPPLLGKETRLAKSLHADARQTFEIRTQAYLRGEKPPATKLKRPFFIPVEFRPPDGREAVKFAFLESNGEWYRTKQEKGQQLSDMSELYNELKPQIEQVIERFQGGISFIYVAPMTQGQVYREADNHGDVANLESASQALVGVLKCYERIRQNGGRPLDKHLMLVTKWDKRGAGQIHRAGEIEEDREALTQFFATTYMQAHAEFTSINVEERQKALNAYCSGIMGENGLLPIGRDEDTKAVVESYPIRLWTWLYKNALEAEGGTPSNPFPERRPSPPIVRTFRKLLDFVSGGQ